MAEVGTPGAKTPIDLDLNSIETFVDFLKKQHGSFFLSKDLARGNMFCGKCGGMRRHSVLLRCTSERGKINYANDIFAQAAPLVHTVHCSQCDSQTFVLMSIQNKKPALLAVSEYPSRYATPNTPAPVTYYLVEAARCMSVSARSAAASMYRAALEQILFDQGYQNGMLKSKLDQLDEEITSGKAPKWSYGMDTTVLKHLKNIGNGSVHPNGGDIQRQEAIDEKLLSIIGSILSILLERVYEAPVREEQERKHVEEAAKVLS